MISFVIILFLQKNILRFKITVNKFILSKKNKSNQNMNGYSSNILHFQSSKISSFDNIVKVHFKKVESYHLKLLNLQYDFKRQNYLSIQWYFLKKLLLSLLLISKQRFHLNPVHWTSLPLLKSLKLVLLFLYDQKLLKPFVIKLTLPNAPFPNSSRISYQ